MSVVVDVLVVDWSKVQSQLADGKAVAQIVEGLSSEDLPSDSIRWCESFLEFFDSFANDLDSELVEAFDAIFDKLLPSCRVEDVEPLIELDLEPESSEYLTAALAPQTVAEMAADAQRLDFDQLETACSSRRHAKELAYAGFGQFATDLRVWLDVVKRAAASQSGILVFVYF